VPHSISACIFRIQGIFGYKVSTSKNTPLCSNVLFKSPYIYDEKRSAWRCLTWWNAVLWRRERCRWFPPDTAFSRRKKKQQPELVDPFPASTVAGSKQSGCKSKVCLLLTSSLSSSVTSVTTTGGVALPNMDDVSVVVFVAVVSLWPSTRDNVPTY